MAQTNLTTVSATEEKTGVSPFVWLEEGPRIGPSHRPLCSGEAGKVASGFLCGSSASTRG
jgi:hypothetical protein